jgi:hypothetical protein
MSRLSIDFSRKTTRWDRAVTSLFMAKIEQPGTPSWLLEGLSLIPGVDLNAREARSGQACIVRAMAKKKPRLAFMLANNTKVDPGARDYVGLSPLVMSRRFHIEAVDDALVRRGAVWTVADDERLRILKQVDQNPKLQDMIGLVNQHLYALGEGEGDIPPVPARSFQTKTNRF